MSAARIDGGIERTRDLPDFETLTYSTILTYLTLTPGGVSRGYSMAAPQPNPLLSHILGAVADRQTADVARLELLNQVGREVERCNGKLDRLVELLEELVERTRK